VLLLHTHTQAGREVGSLNHLNAQKDVQMNELHVSFQNNCAAKADELVKLQNSNKQQLAIKDAEMAELKAQLRLIVLLHAITLDICNGFVTVCNGF
jgi:hypothetical protein